MSKKIKWTDKTYLPKGATYPCPEKKPKVKYILNTDFGPIKKGTEMRFSDGEYFIVENNINLSVPKNFVTKVTEFVFGDRVMTFKEGDNVLTFISSNSNNESWIIHDGAETPFRVPTVNLIPAL